MSKIQGILFLASLALVSQNVQAENQCSENSAAEAVKQLGDIVDSMYDPPDRVNSCAVKLHKMKKANWKDSVDLEAASFLNQKNEFLAQIQKEIVKDFQFYLNDSDTKAARQNYKNSYQSKGANNPELRALGIKITDANKKEHTRFTQALYEKISSDTTLKRLIAKSKSRSCSAGISFSLEPEDGFHKTLNSDYKDDETAEIALRKEVTKYQNETKTADGGTLSSIRVCSDPVPIQAPLVDTISKESFELPGEVVFADNSTILNVSTKAKIESAIQKALRTTKANCKKEVTALNVQGASNALKGIPNPEIGDPDGWHFKAVSKARANAIQDQIVRALKSAESAGTVQLRKDFDRTPAEYEGSNGDGTNGPCPYVIETSKSGVLSVVHDNLDKEDLAQLSKAKSSKASLEIIEKCSTGGNEKEAPNAAVRAFASKCYEVIPSCK